MKGGKLDDLKEETAAIDLLIEKINLFFPAKQRAKYIGIVREQRAESDRRRDGIESMLLAHAKKEGEWLESVKALLEANQGLREKLEFGWTIIANASGGNWDKETKDWRDAAAKWRDESVPEFSRVHEAVEAGKETTQGQEGYKPGTGSIIISAPRVMPG